MSSTPTSQPAQVDYGKLALRFRAVRRSWKRAAALSGSAVVLSEGLGIFGVLLFLDWLFQPTVPFRFCFWGAGLGLLGYFAAKHVLRPLLRRIPDEQIALYIEERRNDLDGVLITAAEFGTRGSHDPGQAALVDAIIRSAAERSEKVSLGRLVDLSRLRKYGVLVVSGLAGYALLLLLFPNMIGRRMERVLAPWNAALDVVPAGERALEPLKIELSQTETKLQRGTSFEFDASLSRPASAPLVLNFRAATGSGAWQTAPMGEIDKLHSYHGLIPDVNEDLEFYVSSGQDKTPTHRITVFDPLIVESIETAIEFPEYTRLPARTENPSSGDVTALVGSKVTVRIHTNTALKEGSIQWAGGATLPVTVEAPSTAAFTFEVKEDATYDFHLADVNGQKNSSPAPLSVVALPDKAPTLEVASPVSPVLTHPLGEIYFEAGADDDFSLDSVVLVYSRIDAKGELAETRVPLTLEAAEGEAPGKRCSHRLLLEELKPLCQSQEAILFHLEAADTRGQRTASPIGLIIIGYYDTWSTWSSPSGGSSGGALAADVDLMALLSLVWTLDGQKTSLVPADFKAQAAEIAQRIVDESGNMRSFVDLEKMPQLRAVAGQIAERGKRAHEALVNANTGLAAAELSIAAALYAGNGVLADVVLPPASSGGSGGSSFHLPTTAMLERARVEALSQPTSEKARSEKESTETKAAAGAGKAIEDLIKKQDQVTEKANQQAAAEGGGGVDAKAKGSLAGQQRELAEKTKNAANQTKSSSSAAPGSKLAQAADKTAAAARTMEEAARDIAAGNAAAGAAKSANAKAQLLEAKNILADTSRDKLEAAISEAGARAAALLANQVALRAESEASSGELPVGKSPDQRQSRDLQKQAFRQNGLRGEMEGLAATIDDLKGRAELVGNVEALRGLVEAQRGIKRGQPQMKMGNAVVELNNGAPGTAVEEQKRAEETLAKLIEQLGGSSDALAASRDAQLRRASRSAAEAKAALVALAPKDASAAGAKGADGKGTDGKGADGKGADGKGADGKGADGKGADGKGADGKGTDGKGADGKGADGKGADGKGADGKGADGKGADGKGTDGKGADGKGADGKGADGKGADGKGADGKGADGKGAEGSQPGNLPGGGGGSKVSYALQRLAANLENRDLVSKAQVDRVKELSSEKGELEKRLLVDPTLLQEVNGLVASISEKLEAESEARSAAGVLQSSQREECPPAYRQFVNKYFESLSTTPRPQKPEAP